jgi:hypothetical protein
VKRRPETGYIEAVTPGHIYEFKMKESSSERESHPCVKCGGMTTRVTGLRVQNATGTFEREGWQCTRGRALDVDKRCGFFEITSEKILDQPLIDPGRKDMARYPSSSRLIHDLKPEERAEVRKALEASEPLDQVARRFRLNDTSLRNFMLREFPRGEVSEAKLRSAACEVLDKGRDRDVVATSYHVKRELLDKGIVLETDRRAAQKDELERDARPVTEGEADQVAALAEAEHLSAAEVTALTGIPPATVEQALERRKARAPEQPVLAPAPLLAAPVLPEVDVVPAPVPPPAPPLPKDPVVEAYRLCSSMSLSTFLAYEGRTREAVERFLSELREVLG